LVAHQLQRVLRHAGISSAVTVARPALSLAGIGDAHNEAVETAEYHVIGASDEPLLSWELLSRPAERWPTLPPARTDALLDAVAQGLEADAHREARAFMAYAREHVPAGALRALWFEIVVLLVNRVRQFGVRADALLEPRQDLRALLAGFADANRQEEQLVALSGRAARECGRLRTHYSPRATIQELREYIVSHIAGDLTIAALAQRMHLNAKYLGEVFKQSTGESLGEYVIRARIKRASELLVTTSLKVHVIAEHIGYADPKHFATMFRSINGMSPAEYREHCRTQQELPEERA
jgi:AraC-like DNA-binding protein